MTGMGTPGGLSAAAQRRIDAAAILGRAAARRKKPASTNPYQVGSADPVERACAVAWTRAHLTARPPHGVVDYDEGPATG